MITEPRSLPPTAFSAKWGRNSTPDLYWQEHMTSSTRSSQSVGFLPGRTEHQSAFLILPTSGLLLSFRWVQLTGRGSLPPSAPTDEMEALPQEWCQWEYENTSALITLSPAQKAVAPCKRGEPTRPKATAPLLYWVLSSWSRGVTQREMYHFPYPTTSKLWLINFAEGKKKAIKHSS